MRLSRPRCADPPILAPSTGNVTINLMGFALRNRPLARPVRPVNCSSAKSDARSGRGWLRRGLRSGRSQVVSLKQFTAPPSSPPLVIRVQKGRYKTVATVLAVRLKAGRIGAKRFMPPDLRQRVNK